MKAFCRLLLGKKATNPDAAVALAELPLQIRGFGPVKQQNVTTVGKRREELLAMIRAGGTTHSAAAE